MICYLKNLIRLIIRYLLIQHKTQCTKSGHSHVLVVYMNGGSVVKNPPINAEDLGSIPGSGGSPREGNGNPAFLPGKSCGQRILEGYSP